MPCSSTSPDRFAMLRRTCLFSLVGLALVAAPGGASAGAPEAAAAAKPAPAITLEGLLARFAEMSGLQATFREEKRMALLAVPLVNEGTIYFVPNAGAPRLARHTTLPAPSVVVIDGATLRVADAAGREEISLDRNPPVRLFVDSFVKIFAGDRAALSTMYAMELAAEGDKWTLRLKPKVAPIDKLVERVEISGEGVVIASMRVVEVGGDETVTSFSAVDTKRRFTAEESAALFSLPPPRR